MLNPALCCLLALSLAPALCAEQQLTLSVKPKRVEAVLGNPILLTLVFTRVAGPPVPVELGKVGLDAITISVTKAGGASSTHKCHVEDGWDPHVGTDFVVDGPIEYGIVLDEFVVFENPGTYRVGVSVAAPHAMQAETEVSVIDSGSALLENLAKRALSPTTIAADRAEAGRLLSRFWSPAAVPHLVELMGQYQFHGTDVMTDAMRSIMRSEHAAGITWLWKEAGGQRVPPLTQYAEFFRAEMRRFAAARPTSMVAQVVGSSK